MAVNHYNLVRQYIEKHPLSLRNFSISKDYSRYHVEPTTYVIINKDGPVNLTADKALIALVFKLRCQGHEVRNEHT